MQVPWVFDGPINGVCFRAYVEQHLIPVLKPGDIVIMDNLGSHKSAAIRKAITAAGARRWFLPPYSPDLNPIEQAFSKIKHWMRNAQKRTVDETWRHIGSLLDTIKSDECVNYLEDAGDGATVTFDWPKRLSVETDLAWWSATGASKSTFVGIEGRYAPGVTLEADPPMKLTVNKLKWLLDGLISSLHFDSDPAEPAVAKLAGRNHWPSDEVRRRLMEPPTRILGARKVFSESWSPADELCDACNIEIIPADRPRCTFTISPIP